MADGPHKYHIVGSVGGGGMVTDLQSVFGVGRGRRVKIFAYGFLFAFVAATAFLAFNPSVATSSPWFDRFFSASSSTSASSSVRSQFSNLISSIFPASHPSVTANAARPSGATEKGVVSGSRATNFTASSARTNATIGASEAARNGTKHERSPAASKTAPAKNATKIESSDQKAPASSKNQTFSQNPKNQTMSLDKQPSSVAGDRRNKSKTVDLKPKNGTFASNPTAKKVDADQPARQYSMESMKKCDLFDGKWVKDDSYPLYKEGSCPYIDQPFDCFLNGRPDQDFQKLRWQPKGCNIPRQAFCHY